jgi:hypothetical protein
MTVRSVVISFFIIAFSFGMTITNEMNAAWANEHSGLKFIDYDMTPYMNYSDIGIPSDRAGYNNTMKTLTRYDKPTDVSFNLDFFQSIKYGGLLINILMNSVYGFPSFLNSAFGMPYFLVIPITLFLVLNHILAVIYIVTGRSFLY